MYMYTRIQLHVHVHVTATYWSTFKRLYQESCMLSVLCSKQQLTQSHVSKLIRNITNLLSGLWSYVHLLTFFNCISMDFNFCSSTIIFWSSKCVCSLQFRIYRTCSRNINFKNHSVIRDVLWVGISFRSYPSQRTGSSLKWIWSTLVYLQLSQEVGHLTTPKTYPPHKYTLFSWWSQFKWTYPTAIHGCSDIVLWTRKVARCQIVHETVKLGLSFSDNLYLIYDLMLTFTFVRAHP